MKKALLLILGAAVLFGIFAVSCSSDKKKKVTSNTASIIIDPADLSDGIGYSSSVVITGRISTDANATIQQWTISDSVLGTINGSTAAVLNTNSITYASASSGDAAGYIRAHWNGLTKDGKVAIGTCAGVSHSTGTEQQSSKFLIYSDIGLGEGINTTEMCWTYPGGQTSNPCAVMEEQNDVNGATGDSSKYYKIVNDYDSTGSGGNKISGWNFKLNTKRDMSDYKTLVFYAKGSTSSDKLCVEFGSLTANDSGTLKTFINLTTSWQQYSINISGVNRTSLGVLANFVFANDQANNYIPDETVYIDYIYLEK